jgi:hypothetical protein
MGNHREGLSCTMPEDYYEHSTPEQWMVALVGLMHMVPSAVNIGRQRILVFEGNEDIRADLLS